MSRDHLVPELFEQPLHPGGVAPYFDHHTTTRHPFEPLAHRALGRRDPALLANLTALVQHAQLAVPVAKINTDRHAGSVSGNLSHVDLRSWA